MFPVPVAFLKFTEASREYLQREAISSSSLKCSRSSFTLKCGEPGARQAALGHMYIPAYLRLGLISTGCLAELLRGLTMSGFKMMQKLKPKAWSCQVLEVGRALHPALSPWNFSSVKERSYLTGLRGMKAKEDIPGGEAIASVSLESTLLVQPFKRSPFPDFCSDKQWKKSPW